MHLWKLCPVKKSGREAILVPFIYVVKHGSFDRQDPPLSETGIADSLSAAPPFSLLVAIFES